MTENSRTTEEFPPKCIEMIKTFYNEIETCTTNNGHISQFFRPERGVRQGCPLSPMLFVIVVELLSTKIRNNNIIEGITNTAGEFKVQHML